jgi:glycosyltransferase involved in cell wall biosynthesis
LATASIYWHGGGFGEDPELHPERFEHFGIAVVEAMAAGAVPVVFSAAGPAEIVRHAIDGFHWKTLGELQAYTRVLMNDETLRLKMSASAQERAAEFSVEVFGSRINALL